MRPTDASGFYVPLSVLQDHGPVPNHRPWDLNAADPFVEVLCGNEPAKLIEADHRRYYRCANGRVPIGYRNISAGRHAKDNYTLRVCASRKFLYPHMEKEGREKFKDAFRVCGIA